MTARHAGVHLLRSSTFFLDADSLSRLRLVAFRIGAVVERDGLTVLGFGEALTIELPNGLTDPAALRAVTETLESIRPLAPSPSGRKPVAVGALPFLPAAASAVVVPRVTVLAGADDRPVAIVVAADPAETHVTDLLDEDTAGDEPPPDSFRLESRRPHQDFLERVAAAVDEVKSGRLDKVVMAREVIVEANRPLQQSDLLKRLRALHPSCTTFAVDGFIGATPELLMRRRGNQIESHPLAGTAARSGDPEADMRAEQALLNSDKERAEHRAVVDAIVDGLSPAVSQLEVPDTPCILELRNVSHLGTHIRGRLAPRQDGSLPNALEALSLIHPTPAVSGTPIDTAIEYIDKAEDLDRDRYAGALGWIDADGDGEWHLGIRCAIVSDNSARLFAGVGIVADSDPAAELAETQLKLQAFLAAAVRP